MPYIYFCNTINRLEKEFTLRQSAFLLLFTVTILFSPWLHAESYTAPKLLDTDYSSDLLYNTRNGLEGWVFFNYVIDESGDVRDIIVVDSSNDERILKSGIRHLEKLKYEPALLNETKVVSRKSFLFLLLESRPGQDRTAVSKNYKKKYDNILSLLNERKFKEAGAAIEILDTEVTKNLFEHARTAWLKSMYYYNTQQFNHYTREMNVVILLKEYLPTKTVAAGMSSLFESYLYYNELGRALNVIATMSSYDGVNLTEEVEGTFVERVFAKAKNEEDIKVVANIPDSGVYYHMTLGSKYTIQRLSGEVSSYDLRCQNFRETGKDFDNLEIDVSKAGSQSCDLFVMGSPGASFKLQYDDLWLTQ